MARNNKLSVILAPRQIAEISRKGKKDGRAIRRGIDMSLLRRAGTMIVGSPRERRDIAGWLLRFGVGGLFILISLGKFNSDPHGMWYQVVAKIGIGQWFRITTGVIQFSGGILFLFPGTCRVGGAMLAATRSARLSRNSPCSGTQS